MMRGYMLNNRNNNYGIGFYTEKNTNRKLEYDINKFIVYLPVILLTACYAIFLLQQNLNHKDVVHQIKQPNIKNSVSSKYVKLPNYKLLTDVNGQAVRHANTINVVKLSELYKTHI